MEKRHCDVEEGRVLRYLRGPYLFSFGKGSTLPSNDTVNWTHRTTTNFSVFSVCVRVCSVCLFPFSCSLRFLFRFSLVSFLVSVPSSAIIINDVRITTRLRGFPRKIPNEYLRSLILYLRFSYCFSSFFRFFFFFLFFESFVLLAPPPPLPAPLFFTAAARTRPVSRYTNV